ncbi:MAG: TonB-dependent receptor [Treponema sp.]|jgi:outer membrane cobalamin receptor|nr:TonB-dependent receptor [Treponema sp.]
MSFRKNWRRGAAGRAWLAAVLLGLCAGGSLSAQEDGDYDDYLDFGEDEEGITIFGAPETTQQMTVITRDEIEKRNARDLASLLEETLDMSVTRYGGGYGNQTELNLRGFDTERIAILVDGVPANSPRSGEFDLGQIDINNVERIEVIYGGSDTKYNVSGALGGLINIVTVKKQPRGLGLEAALSNTGYLPGKYNSRHEETIGGPNAEDLADMQSLSFAAGYGAEKFSWRASLYGNRAGNHYLYQDDYGFARRKISNEVFDVGGGAVFALDLPDTATLVFDTKTYYTHKNFPVTPNSTGSAAADDFQVTENVLFNAPFIFHRDLGAEASLSYQYSITKYGTTTKSFDHYITGINRWNWYPGEKITLRAGSDWRFLYIDSRSATETQPVKTGNQGGLYLTGEFLPLKQLMIIVSAKGVTDTKEAVVVPKLGLRWDVTPSFVLKNNYFRSFKFPDFDDLYYRSLDSFFVGNPGLKAEDGIGADLTGEFTAGRLFSINATVYGQYTTDSIHWVKSAGGRWSPENIGTAWFAGLDARPGLTLPLKRGKTVTLGLSYQFQLSWLLNGSLGFKDSFRIPYMPTHIIGGSVDLKWKTGSLLVSAHYESTRYADTLNQMALAPYCAVHLTYNQGIGSNITLFGSLRNILNARYESFAGYYMPGVSLILGLRAKLPPPGESPEAAGRD